MKTFGWLSLLSCALMAVSCMNSETQRVARPMSLDSVPSLPMVDAKTLLISDINVTQFSNPKLAGAIQPLVDFRYSGSAEYVEVVTCVDSQSSCSEAKDIFKTESTLANAPGGSKVIVKLRACVNPSRATSSSNCGEWFQSSYTQWTVTDREKAALVEEQESIEIAKKEFNRQLEAILKKKLERANKCKAATPEQTAALAADKALAEALGKLGQSALGVITDGIVKGGGACDGSGKESGTPDATGTATATPTATAAAPANGQKLLLNLSAPGGSNPSGLIGPSALSPENLKTVIDKISDALQKKGADNAAQCLAQQTSTKAGKLTLNDVGAVLPSVAGAIFSLVTAGREVALEGICIESLNQKLDTAIQTATAAAKILGEELQARQAR
ncbi:hypothetical protein EBR21_08375, partial [bacterium]|nr:hypothetical protein [bacterium]